jgi:hypothetical protein
MLSGIAEMYMAKEIYGGICDEGFQEAGTILSHHINLQNLCRADGGTSITVEVAAITSMFRTTSLPTYRILIVQVLRGLEYVISVDVSCQQ